MVCIRVWQWAAHRYAFLQFMHIHALVVSIEAWVHVYAQGQIVCWFYVTSFLLCTVLCRSVVQVTAVVGVSYKYLCGLCRPQVVQVWLVGTGYWVCMHLASVAAHTSDHARLPR